MRIQAMLESTDKLVIDGLYNIDCSNVKETVNCEVWFRTKLCTTNADLAEANSSAEDLEEELGLTAFFTELKNVKVHDS